MAVLELTNTTRVKALLDLTKADHDTVLDSIIKSVSMSIELYLGRVLLNQSRTVELDVAPRQRFFWLEGFPVGSITSVKSSKAWDWGNVDAIASTLYHVEGATGRLAMDTGISVGPNALQVVYAGGLASTTTGLITSNPDLAFAADLQVAEEFRRRDDPSLKSKSFATEKARSYVGGLMLLDRVREIINPYRRLSLG